MYQLRESRYDMSDPFSSKDMMNPMYRSSGSAICSFSCDSFKHLAAMSSKTSLMCLICSDYVLLNMQMLSMVTNTNYLKFSIRSNAVSMYWMNCDPAVFSPIGTFWYTYVLAPT